MKNIFKYTLSASFALAISAVSASADSHYADQTVTDDESFKAVYLPSAVITNDTSNSNQINDALDQQGVNPNDVNLQNQSNVVREDNLSQVYANMPDWARETIYNGGQIGYIELEITSTDDPKPRIEKLYYKINEGDGTASIENKEVQTTQQILSRYGIDADDLPPIGEERWPLKDGDNLTINYWVNPSIEIQTKNGAENYSELVDLAVNQWNDQLAGVKAPIKFVRVSDKNKALYRFELGDNTTVVAGQELSGLSGRTIMYVNDSKDIFLKSYGLDTYINESAITKAYNKNQTVNVIAHEIGHSIGLEHTDKKDQLMYTSPHNQTIRKADAVAALIMYSTENIPGKDSKQIFG